MSVARIIASPPRVQSFEVDAAQEDIEHTLPEIITNLPAGVKVHKLGLAWRGYRELDEFIIDKTLDLLVEGDPLDVQVYCQTLAASGIIGNIVLYIMDRNGDRPITTIVLVDQSEDDVTLAEIVKLAGVCFVDGFVLTLTPNQEGGRIVRIISHFMLVDNTIAATRTSLLYTKLVDKDLDVRLLLTDLNSQVYYFEGFIEEEEQQEDFTMIDQPQFEPGSLEELQYNLLRETE